MHNCWNIDVPSSHTSPVQPGAQWHRRFCEHVAPFWQGGSQTAVYIQAWIVFSYYHVCVVNLRLLQRGPV